MTTDVQHGGDATDPARALLDAARRVAPGWLRRETAAAAARGGITIAPDDPDLVAVVDTAAGRLLDDLAALLDTDVDEQRSNPLSVFRRAVAGPTELLLRRGARPPAREPFAAAHFPDDVFGLGPAAWADVDPELHDAGITWGAWKALTILRRRRDAGLR